MEIQAQNVYVNQTFADAILGTFSTPPAAGLIGATPTVHLLQGSVQLTPQTLLADLVAQEATYTGYAPATPQTAVGKITPLSNVRAIIWTALFSTEGDPAGTQVTGYWLEGGTPNDWIVGETLLQPISLGPSSDVLAMTVVVPISELVRVS